MKHYKKWENNLNDNSLNQIFEVSKQLYNIKSYERKI